MIFAGMVGIGIVVGLLIGLTGIGSGSILGAALLLSGTPASHAVGTSIVFALLTKLPGSFSFYRRGLVHGEIARDLSLGCVPGTLSGGLVLYYLGLRDPQMLEFLLGRLMGAVLIVVSLIMLLRLLPLHVRPRLVDRTLPFASWQRSAVIILVGFVVGLSVSLTSVGAGAALIPAMVLFYRLDSGTLVGTNVFVGAIIAVTASALHIFLGNVDWGKVLALVAGSIPGVWVTSRWHGRIPRHIPEGIIAVALLVMGVGLVTR